MHEGRIEKTNRERGNEIHMRSHLCLYTYLCIYLHICVFIYLYDIYKYINIFVYLYIYIYTYINYTRTHTHIYLTDIRELRRNKYQVSVNRKESQSAHVCQENDTDNTRVQVPFHFVFRTIIILCAKKNGEKSNAKQRVEDRQRGLLGIATIYRANRGNVKVGVTLVRWLTIGIVCTEQKLSWNDE